MKLQTKFKDYYDFIIHQYGVDDKIFYNRNGVGSNRKISDFIEFSPMKEEGQFFTLFFCGDIYTTYLYKGKFYWDIESIIEIHGEENIYKNGRLFFFSEIYEDNYCDSSREDFIRLKVEGDFRMGYVPFNANKVEDKNKINEKLDSPIILIDTSTLLTNSYYTKGIIDDIEYSADFSLEMIGFNKVLQPTDTYLKLCSFLSYKEPELLNLTDKEKIKQAGFDVKTSFRNM